MPLRPSLEPDWKFTVYPRTAIGGRQIPAWVVADLLANALENSPSSNLGYYVASSEGIPSENWLRLNNDFSISECGFSRFNRNGSYVTLVDGTSDALSRGLHLLKKRVPMQATIGGGAFPAKGNGALPWRQVMGSWAVVPQLEAKGASAVLNKGSQARSIIETPSTPQGQPLSLDLTSYGRIGNSTTRSTVYARIGQNLRVAMREGLPYTLEYATYKTTVEGEVIGSTLKWGPLKTLEELPVFVPSVTRTQMSFEQIGGRFVWKVDGQAYHLLDASPDNEDAARPLEWGGVPLRVETENVRLRVETHALSSADTVGVVKRRLSKKSSEAQAITSPQAGGHFPKGTSVEISTEEGEDYIDYTATLRGDEAGTLTPLLSQIYLIQKPVWVSGSGGGYDLSAAVTRADVSHAHPPLQAGTEGSVTVDIPLLRSKVNPAVENFIGDYCPFEISARNKTHGVPDGDYKGLFRGYLYGTSGDESAYNTGSLSFTLRDPIVRLREPAGVVTGRTAPLDFAFLEQLRNAAPDWQLQEPTHSVVPDNNGIYNPLTNRDKQWFGVQCVREILLQFLGPDAANSLNGGDLFQFVPDDYAPLLDYNRIAPGFAFTAAAFGADLSSASLKSQTGFIFEPPYKQDALSWINKFCADEFCKFFYGWLDRDQTGWPVPIYGRYDELMKRSKLFQVALGELENLRSETRPDVDFNHVEVFGNNFDAQIPLGRSFIHGEAKLPYGHPSSEYATWARTKVLETNLAVRGEFAMAAAAIALAEHDNNGLLPQWPTFSMRGTTGAQVGDVFTTTEPRLLSSVNGLWFRSPKITHSYSNGPTEGRTSTTTAALARMSRREEQAFRRANGLPLLG